MMSHPPATEMHIHPLPRLFVAALALFVSFLIGCATDEAAQPPPIEDTSWIQKGRTTREEVVAKLQEPGLTLNLKEGGGQYVEYSIPVMGDSYEQGGLSSPFEPRPQGPFPQVYRPPTDTLEPADGGNRLWIQYDANGVVQDFGIRPPRNPR